MHARGAVAKGFFEVRACVMCGGVPCLASGRLSAAGAHASAVPGLDPLARGPPKLRR